MLQIFAGPDAVNVASVDLDRSTDFEIEIEQPILTEDGMPVPFSTAIEFPVTPANKEIFGYLPFLALEPTQKELYARICYEGITLIQGMLTFDGIGGGRLKYTFSGQDITAAETWKRKIWDLSPEHEAALPDDCYEFPVLLLEEATGKLWHPTASPIGTGATPGTGGSRTSSPTSKYRNYGDLWASYRNVQAPAIRVSAILSEAFAGVQVPQLVSRFWNRCAIIGNYPTTNPDGSRSRTSIVSPSAPDQDSDAEIWFSDLPDLTVAEFAREVLKLRAAAVFYDGSGIVVKTADEVLSDSPIDWSGKVSDVFELTDVEKQHLLMGWSDIQTPKAAEDPDIPQYDSLSEILDAAEGSDSSEYENYMHATLKDVYSIKKTGDREKEIGDIAIQCLFAEESANDDAPSLDLRSSLIPVRCVPDRLYTKNGTWVDRLVPVVKINALNGERGKVAYIGILKNGQMCDKGVVIDDDEDTGADDSLDIRTLYANVPDFGNWLATPRKRIEVDLALSFQDIAGLRMWHRYQFLGATWIAEKFTIHLSADGRRPTVTGAFISCPL